VQNDQEAHRRFREVVWPHLPAVLRAALVLTAGNSAEAEDLAQETLLKAFRSLDCLTNDAGVRAWLLTILRNTRIDRLRAAKASARDVSLEEIGGEVEAPAEAVAATNVENPEAMLQEFSDRQVIEALAKLPEEIRWTLLLVDVNRMDHRDAAEVMAVPVGTVKSRAHRGRMMLRDVLLPVAKEQRIVRD
jgi:RNA polymerase sigma-70 factor (ECF subfamily)